jgi:hypothetical protein
MKVSNLLSLIALMLVPATTSTIFDQSLDHATANNADRILKNEKASKGSLKKKEKKKEKKKNGKKATKKSKPTK